MTWNDVLIEVVNLLVKIVTVVAVPYLMNLASQKIENDHVQKILAKAEEFVIKSVNMVQQTFVDSLKEQNGFDLEAQEMAFKKCYENWMDMANDEMKAIVTEQVGDLDAWLTTMIEAKIKEDKAE